MATSPLRTLTVLLALAAPTLGAQSAPEPARGSVPAPSGATGTLVGWVTDDSTCAPVAGARVTVDGGRDDVTDADGRFAVGGLAPGAHAVRVERAGYSFAERTGVDVPAGSVNDVDVDLVRTDHAGDRSAGAPGDTATVRVDSSGVAVDVSAGVPAPPRVAWTPRRPRQGALVAITLHDSSARWTAALAGEPLHFRRSGGLRRALAGIPIDAADTTFLLFRRGGAAPAVLRVAVPVARGEYRMERLTVAPRFGTPPDSALAERIARESMIARRLSCRSHHRPQLWRAPFVRPRPSRVTSPFGGGREFNGVVQSRHMGTDLAGQAGAPIRAMNRGVVTFVGEFYLGGRVVYVDHGAGLISAYLHMSRQLVAVGDTVAAGQVIGRVGATGRVTGPHLHWIVRYGTVTVDPMSVFTVAPAK